jgi:hypothetical protein
VRKFFDRGAQFGGLFHLGGSSKHHLSRSLRVRHADKAFVPEKADSLTWSIQCTGGFAQKPGKAISLLAELRARPL